MNEGLQPSQGPRAWGDLKLQASQALPIPTLRCPQVMSLSLSSRPRERDGSSVPLDDNIHRHFSKNESISHLELWQEVDPPKHEFVVLTTGFACRSYRIERRPTIVAGINSMWRGCPTEDTITPFNWWESDYKSWNSLFWVKFEHDPKPDLHTAFAICNAILKDPDAQKYTLREFNCYFFARTLTLLIFRHFLVRQYCRIQKSPRHDFGNFPEPAICAIADQAISGMTDEAMSTMTQYRDFPFSPAGTRCALAW